MRKKSVSRYCTDFEKFAASLKLTSVQYSKAMDRITSSVEDSLSTVLSASFLPEDMRIAIETLVSNRISRIRELYGVILLTAAPRPFVKSLFLDKRQMINNGFMVSVFLFHD